METDIYLQTEDEDNINKIDENHPNTEEDIFDMDFYPIDQIEDLPF